MVSKLKDFFLNYKNIPVEVKASLFYTICSVVQNGIAFITLPIFTRMLSEYQYGQYSIYISWLGIIAIFSSLQLQYGSFNTAMIKYEDDQDRYISAIQGLLTITTLVCFIIYVVFREFFNSILSLPTVLVVVMFIEILAQNVVGFYTNKKRFEYKYKPMVIVTLFIAILSPCVGLIAVYSASEKGIARVLSNAFVWISVGLILYIYQLMKGKAFFHKKYWLFALQFNGALIPYYLSQVIFNQSDRIMIEKMVGMEEAGIYSLAYQVAIVITFVINAINSSYVPWVYRKLKEETYAMIKSITKVLLILVAIILVMIILMGPELVLFLGGSKYYSAIWIIPPVTSSLFFLFLAQIPINIMFYYEDTKSLVMGSILSALINIVLNYICIPRFGFVAAGYTTLLSYIVFWLCNLYYMHKDCRNIVVDYHKGVFFDMKSSSIIAVIFTVFSISVSFVYTSILIRIVLVLVLMGLGFKYRRYFIQLFNDLKK